MSAVNRAGQLQLEIAVQEARVNSVEERIRSLLQRLDDALAELKEHQSKRPPFTDPCVEQYNSLIGRLPSLTQRERNEMNTMEKKIESARRTWDTWSETTDRLAQEHSRLYNQYRQEQPQAEIAIRMEHQKLEILRDQLRQAVLENSIEKT